MPDPVFSFSTADSDPRLRAWIQGCWEFTVAEGAPVEHHVPPDGLAFVVMVEDGPKQQLIAFGPRVTPLVIPTRPGAVYRGLRLAAESGPLLMELTGDELVRHPHPINRIGPVQSGPICSALRGGSLAEARQRVDDLFLPQIDLLPSPDPVVSAALDSIRSSGGRAPLSKVASELDVSPRTVLRRVRNATGLTPKQHARIARFYGAARGLIDPDHQLSQIAMSGGYADQPHLTHEFTSLTGLTPAQLAERVRRTVHRMDG